MPRGRVQSYTWGGITRRRGMRARAKEHNRQVWCSGARVMSAARTASRAGCAPLPRPSSPSATRTTAETPPPSGRAMAQPFAAAGARVPLVGRSSPWLVGAAPPVAVAVAVASDAVIGPRDPGNEEGRRAELLAYERSVGRHGHERERADEKGIVRDRSVEQIASLFVRAEQVEAVHPATLQVPRPLFRRTLREEPGRGRQPAACNDWDASARLVESAHEGVAVDKRVISFRW